MAPKKVLFVDDEQFILNSMARELKEEPFTLTLATGGREAIKQLQDKHYDLVITDILMPDIDGFQVLKAAKTKSSRTVVILLTGYGDFSSAVDALRLGADDFLQKPCDAEELLFRISNCFSRRKLRDQVEMFELILPICAYCKRIREKDRFQADTEGWYTLEEYFAQVQKVHVTHGCCPDCYTKLVTKIPPLTPGESPEW